MNTKEAEKTPVSGKLPLGAINGVFGVHGWNKVFSDTVPRENIVGYGVWYLADKNDKRSDVWKRYEVTAGKVQGKNVVVKLDGIDDRDAAQRLVGCQVAVERDQLPPLSGDEYYWSDLLGFKVVDLQQRPIGVLERMFETGANDVMVVRAAGAVADSGAKMPEQEILVPWIRDSVVKNVGLEEQVIVVDWDPDF